ncbi:Y-family DNA polymerase [Pseudohoeflea coraliihabitans]|uniref:Y-family DNA polymerase n=1 Tax=Pseudohoeflea coraliihabitans TaxID=2860393 RepID=UPI003204966A
MPLGETRRILALAFPALPTDRIWRQRLGPSWHSTAPPEAGRPAVKPLACAERLKGALRLAALDEKAATRGLRIGQGVAEARAICPDLDVTPADPAADHRLLIALADWADRYTPLVGLDSPDGLALDITGCAHLFGGERAMLDDAITRLEGFGFAVQGAIAPTPALAWALARHQPGRIAAPADIAVLMPALPISSLRLPDETTAALARVGLKRLQDVLTAPRAPLARRFGSTVLRRLDRMTGMDGEPISPRRPLAELIAERRFAEPLIDLETITTLSGQLAASLKDLLSRRAAGLRRAELSLFRIDGAVRHIRVGTARPLRDPLRIKQLFAERIASLHEEIDAGYGFELVRLAVLDYEPMPDSQTDFEGAAQGDDLPLHLLADRLAARLGPDRVQVPVAGNSHVPERSVHHVPHVDKLNSPQSGSAKGEDDAGTFLPVSGAARPLRLLRPPEPVTAVAEVPDGPPVTFRWRRSPHHVTRAEGPERIAAEWWHDGENAPTRDYYRVEDEAGRRYWLFREGLYERESSTPRWFLHGFFA